MREGKPYDTKCFPIIKKLVVSEAIRMRNTERDLTHFLPKPSGPVPALRLHSTAGTSEIPPHGWSLRLSVAATRCPHVGCRASISPAAVGLRLNKENKRTRKRDPSDSEEEASIEVNVLSLSLSLSLSFLARWKRRLPEMKQLLLFPKQKR